MKRLALLALLVSLAALPACAPNWCPDCQQCRSTSDCDAGACCGGSCFEGATFCCGSDGCQAPNICCAGASGSYCFAIEGLLGNECPAPGSFL